MRRGSRALVAVTVASAAWRASACSSFDGVAATTDDAAVAVDASTLGDAPADGTVAAFCERRDAAFCWSFDAPPFITGADLTTVHSGVYALDVVDAAASAPNAIELAVFSRGDASSGAAGVQLPLPDAGSTTCEVDMLVVVLGGEDDTAALIDFHDPNFAIIANLSIHADTPANAVTVYAGAVGSPSTLAQNVAVGVWTRIALGVRFGPSFARGGVVGGASTPDLPMDASAAASVRFGLISYAAMSTWKVRLDNLTCDWR